MKRLPSYTTLSINELNRLVQQYSTSGKILINKTVLTIKSNKF